MKTINRIFIVLIMLMPIHTKASKEDDRVKYNFNLEWKVSKKDSIEASLPEFDDASWRNVSLPFAWNEDEAFKKDIKDLSTGIVWYRKHFKIPEHFKGKKVFIEFEGVRQAAEVYINGIFIGLHENGINAFGFDLSDHIFFGEKDNVIAVKTDNSWDYKEKATGTGYQWNDKNFNANYGGIPKNVFLHITGPVFQTLPLFSNLGTTGQYIYARNIDIKNNSADITAETEVKNQSKKEVTFQYEITIDNLDGRTIKTISGGSYKLLPGETKIIKATDKVEGLNFWSWGYGYLYTVHTLLKINGQVIDKVSTRTGFRKTEFANGMVKLNDRVIMIKGYAQRTSNEWPAIGISVPPWMSDYSNRLMIESNANLVRWMHITPWKQDIESCDRMGLMQAMPAGDSEKDKVGRQWEQRVEVMRDAIIYNRNNPSIIFYESGNNDISEEHMLEMKNIRDKYDPYGGRAIGSRNMLDSEIAEYGGEMLYINKSKDKPLWAMEYMRDEGLRKYWDEFSPPYHKDGEGPLYKGKDASAYNRNQDSYAKAAVKRWYEYYRERPGTGDYVSSGGVNIVFSSTNTHHRGTENYRRSGEVDPLRIPKDAFYAHKVMWNGWVDIQEHGTHIIGHWNYKKGITKNIYVVSSGEKVELRVNNKSLGFGRRDYNFLFTFDSVLWEPGMIEAISYSVDGEKLNSDTIKTAGKPERIKLSLISSPLGIKADGADMAIVEIEVVDKDGQRCPTALNMIDFELSGMAEWRGGLAQGPDNFVLSKSLPVECGVNRVILRSITQAGEVKVTAHSTILKAASISFNTIPVYTDHGLSIQLPADNLPVNLNKGPTPNTPSYSVSRESIKILDAIAGTNQDRVALSYDGKQSTRWENDGNIETGWINYTLEEGSQVSEIALKLSGWRTRSYPIVVSANDSIIYQGITSPNLGYYYISLETPIYTNNCKIRLYGQTEFNDTYKLVEITGNLDRETTNDLNVKNASSLNIVDVAFYSKPLRKEKKLVIADDY